LGAQGSVGAARARRPGGRSRFDCAFGEKLRRTAGVAVVEASDLGEFHDASELWWLDRPGLGRVLLQGEVGARMVVVPEVAIQAPAEMVLAQDHDVVEQLTANRADHPFGVGVGASCQLRRMGADQRDVFG